MTDVYPPAFLFGLGFFFLVVGLIEGADWAIFGGCVTMVLMHVINDPFSGWWTRAKIREAERALWRYPRKAAPSKATWRGY